MLSKKEQKFIKSLKIKKYRTREKCFLVEGAKNVQEVLVSDFKVNLIVGTEDFFRGNPSIFQNERKEVVSGDLLSDLGTFKTNDSALAIVEMKPQVPFEFNKSDFLFVLDGVGDPGNLGTIIRTLDWFGFDQVVCSHDCAEFYNPKVIASTMGSFVRVRVYYEVLSDVLPKLHVPIIAADMEGASLYDLDIKKPTVIVMGSESHGISPDVYRLLSGKVHIPKHGKAESLNVGIATGIIASYLRISR